MKTIIFALALALISSVSAFNIDKSTGANFYISSYSDAAMYYNMNVGESVNVYMFGNTEVFCAIADVQDAGNLLATSKTASPLRFTAPNTSMYIMLCFKTDGLSGNNIMVIENTISKRNEQNIIEDSPWNEIAIDAMNELFD